MFILQIFTRQQNNTGFFGLVLFLIWDYFSSWGYMKNRACKTEHVHTVQLNT